MTISRKLFINPHDFYGEYYTSSEIWSIQSKDLPDATVIASGSFAPSVLGRSPTGVIGEDSPEGGHGEWSTPCPMLALAPNNGGGTFLHSDIVTILYSAAVKYCVNKNFTEKFWGKV